MKALIVRSAFCSIFILTSCVIAAYAQAISPKTNDDKFGKLPSNQISMWELSGVRAEISIAYFIDPTLVQERLPPGFRPTTTYDFAQGNPGIAKWLETNSKYSAYLVCNLLFASMDSQLIDRVSVGRNGPSVFASWWISGAAVSPLDKVALGEVNLQLASWYPDNGIDRRKVSSEPTVAFAKVEMTNSKPGEWRLRLRTKGGEVTGEIRVIGEGPEVKYPLPAYSTLFMAGPLPSKYMIFTYYGHPSREVQAKWDFTGEDVLVRSLLGVKKNIIPSQTIMWDGWSAHAGMYKLRK